MDNLTHHFSERSVALLTYALCVFLTFPALVYKSVVLVRLFPKKAVAYRAWYACCPWRFII